MYLVFLFLNLDLGLQLALRHTIYVFKLTISKKRTITRPNKWSKWRLFKFLGTNKKVEFVIFPFFSCIYLLTRQFFVVKTFFFFSWKLDKANSRLGPFTNYVLYFSLLFDHPPTYGYVFAMILLNIYLIKFVMVIFCWPPTHLNGIT